nr:MAG TPA: hypothetical protein [Caudoviricetes sp.]
MSKNHNFKYSVKNLFFCKICLFVKLFVILQPKIIVNNGG